MLKKEITYTDLNGDEVTETFYFNLSKSELIEMEVEQDGGLRATIERIIEANDTRQLVKEFKQLILAAYGQKSPDGKRFIKNEELRLEFEQTVAYDTLFMELATDEASAEAFIRGIMPNDLLEAVQKADANATKLSEVQLPGTTE